MRSLSIDLLPSTYLALSAAPHCPFTTAINAEIERRREVTILFWYSKDWHSDESVVFYTSLRNILNGNGVARTINVSLQSVSSLFYLLMIDQIEMRDWIIFLFFSFLYCQSMFICRICSLLILCSFRSSSTFHFHICIFVWSFRWVIFRLSFHIRSSYAYLSLITISSLRSLILSQLHNRIFFNPLFKLSHTSASFINVYLRNDEKWRTRSNIIKASNVQ